MHLIRRFSIRNILQFDLLHDNPLKVLFCIIIPLIIVNLLSIITTFITNDAYSRYIGQIVFTVTGLLNTVTTTLSQITGGITSAAWIKTAATVQQEDTFIRYLYNSIYAIIIIVIGCVAILLLGERQIFALFSIPQDIYIAAQFFYKSYILSYLIISISTYLIHVNNGTGTASDIFRVNLINSCGNSLMVLILLGIFKLKFVGVGIMTAVNSLVVIAFCMRILIRRGVGLKLLIGIKQPDWSIILRIIKYGLVIAFQSVLCSIGYVAVSIQTNRFLSLDYISVLNVNLPIISPMSSLMNAVSIFVPQNYASGNFDRVRSFIKHTLIICMLYGFLCFLIYAILGKWYFNKLFEDPLIIKNGISFWFLYGLGFIFVPAIYILRTFYESIGYGKTALFAGIGELAGNLLCAFWLIPTFGNIGRSLSYTTGWFLAAVYLFVSYHRLRKRIYHSVT